MLIMQEIADFCESVWLVAMYGLYVVLVAEVVFVAALWISSSVAVAVIAGAGMALIGALLGWCLRDAFPVAASLG